jgi:glycosyltransferase involved in cell wall biosynthesis
MRIVAIAPSQVPSRTANSIQVMKACNAMAALGHTVKLLVPGKGKDQWQMLTHQYGLSHEFELEWIRSLKFLKRYDFSWKALQHAREWGADLVYTWLPQAGVLAVQKKIPAILELHDRPTGRFGPGMVKRFIKLPGNKRTVLITAALKQCIETEFGCTFRKGEAVIAPNGVEYERFAFQPEPAMARKALGITEHPTAVFSGHLYAGRGSELMYSLARELPGIQFLLVGGRDEDVAFWRQKADCEGLKNLVLKGFVPNEELPRYLAAGDVFLMPYERSIAGSSGGNSADICSPMKMFEYMAAGRAILSSDLPVIHEVLNPDNAVFAPPEDLEAWTTALTDLIRKTDHRHQLAQQARQDVQHYTWKTRERTILDGFIKGKGKP